MYHLLFEKFFTRLDPETAHHLAYGWIRAAGRVPADAARRPVRSTQSAAANCDRAELPEQTKTTR